MMWQWLALFFIGGVSVCSAQQPRDMPSARFPTIADALTGNVDLPAHIMAPNNQITLFADFSAASEVKGIPIYLVNRTEMPISISTQDGDTYVKLETRTKTGEWVRAQAHVHSGCGNSYGQRVLPPGMHYQMRGYYPKNGIPSRVRFKGYRNLKVVSNEGMGRYLPSDVEDCAVDLFARLSLPGAAIEWFSPLSGIREEGLSRYVAGLRLAKLLGDHSVIRTAASEWLAQLEVAPRPSDEKKLALAAVRELVESPWPKANSQNENDVLRACLHVLTHQDEAEKHGQFGSLVSELNLIWEVVLSMAEAEWRQGSEILPDRDLWKDLILLALEFWESGEANASFLCEQLLRITAILDECVQSEDFEPFLAADSFEVRRIAAETLSRRFQWERMAELGSKLSPEAQAMVFVALIFGPAPSQDQGLDGKGGVRDLWEDSVELRFRNQVIAEHPLEILKVLRNTRVNGLEEIAWSFGASLGRSLFGIVEKELHVSESNPEGYELGENAGEMSMAVEFLELAETGGAPSLLGGDDGKGEEKLKELLRSLLTHTGYQMNEWSTFGQGGTLKQRTAERVFVVRSAAAAALTKLGEKVPDGVVFRETVDPDTGKPD